jgi:hypothetical protein
MGICTINYKAHVCILHALEILKLITTNYPLPKCKISTQADAFTYEDTTAHMSTTRKITKNDRLSVNPQDDWGFFLPYVHVV